MKIRLMIGGIRFQFESDFEITVEESLSSFLCIDENICEVNVKLVCGDCVVNNSKLVKTGEDLLLEYYQYDSQILCMAKAGEGRYLSSTLSDRDFSRVECRLHFFPEGKMKSLGVILRLIPMCAILQRKKVLFIHASQIEVSKKGIVFVAPSGTGKTTQVKLWNKYRNAQIICNDRTLIQKGKTYGFPVDGSEPVASGRILSLGAIILLRQGKKNKISRLDTKEAILKLMPELIINTWDPESRIMAVDYILELIKEYPIYIFYCTPDEESVVCLEQQLKLDGVI